MKLLVVYSVGIRIRSKECIISFYAIKDLVKTTACGVKHKLGFCHQEANDPLSLGQRGRGVF